ncbi:glutaredoxin [Striga asiatica]|uniref:Glutaredoxin n=1 Tax=Striga asiatica TaxID=4170 RepID=A0A5A7PKE9_STRAF|nr:glutaredoxin [Striga asiatica]
MAAALFWLSAPCPSPPNLVRLSNSRHPYNPIFSNFTSSQDYGRRPPIHGFVGLNRNWNIFNQSLVNPAPALAPELKSSLDKVVNSHKILKSLNVAFETINIMENELLRQALKEYSSWPTFPQLYVDSIVGKC